MKLALSKAVDTKTASYKPIYIHSLNCCSWVHSSVLFSLRDTRCPKSHFTIAEQYYDYHYFCSVFYL